ncbi:zf-HC2 domain-containing protein [Pendulispora brunnea]|uniref:Zf-HC2 domain-containing protein n=1 Tax=Pendulispora brunnea TaxID=2905690 RepID=A0ABZ2KMY3_9BACT
MDCEKFESALMDELYDELDELTSAASKRHVAGCARCASLLHGLSATRRIAILETVEPPAGLEERILAATKEAQKVVPLRGRISRVVSWAGSWAMRPQTAMAAVFLLMIGSTSVLLLRARSSVQQMGSAPMVVTEQGAPAASAAPDEQDNPLDTDRATGAHGAVEARKPAPPAAPPAFASAEGWVAKDEARRERTADDKEKEAKEMPLAAATAPAALGAAGSFEGSESNAAGGAPVQAAPPAVQAQSPAKVAVGGAKTGVDSQAGGASQAQGDQGASLDVAMASYRAHNYDEATRSFDGLAATGNSSASLWAARSVRESQGCAAAVPRFEQVAARAYGTSVGYDATFEGALCYKTMGQTDKARALFGRLLTVPTHAARAQSELDAMSAKGGVRNMPMRKTAPPPASEKK